MAKYYIELTREQFMDEVYGKLPRMAKLAVVEMRPSHTITVKPERFRLGRSSEVTFSDLTPHKLASSSDF